MKKTGAGMALLLVLAVTARAAELVPAAVQDHVTRRVEQGYAVGIAIAVVDGAETTYFNRGKFSPDTDRAIDENTLFEIGSITKTFTVTLLADMVQRGQADLDDPVQEYLPATAHMPTRAGKQITLRHLATHRSGLPRMPDFEPKDPANPYASFSAAEMLDFLSHYNLKRDIDAAYEYSNLGVGLLGYALGYRAEQPYEKLVVARICDPLGLKDTRVVLSREQQSRLAPGFAAGRPAANWTFDALPGAGALRSTTRDMLRYVSANLGIQKSSLDLALQATHEGRVQTGQPQTFVALGWHVTTQHDATYFWHNGQTGGYHAFCGFRPDRKLGVVVLTNSTDDIDDIGMHLLDPQHALPALRQTVVVPGKVLEDYVGWYELAPGAVFHVTHDGDQLFAELTGQEKLPVYATSQTEFFYKAVEASMTFVRGDGGKVDRLVLHQNGDHPAPRLAHYEPPKHVEVVVDPALLARYAGRYQLAPGVLFDVLAQDGKLQVKLGDQPRFPVFPESDTTFFYKVVEATITFVSDPTGKVTSLVLNQGGREQTAAKVE